MIQVFIASFFYLVGIYGLYHMIDFPIQKLSNLKYMHKYTYLTSHDNMRLNRRQLLFFECWKQYRLKQNFRNVLEIINIVNRLYFDTGMVILRKKTYFAISIFFPKCISVARINFYCGIETLYVWKSNPTVLELTIVADCFFLHFSCSIDWIYTYNVGTIQRLFVP